MCGRYTLFSSLETIIDRFSVAENGVHVLTKNYNAHPGQSVLTILKNNKNISTKMMKWGFERNWTGNNGNYKTIHNSRVENLLTKPTFRSLVKKQRCLIPSNGFYEWKKSEAGNTPFFIHTPQNSLFAFAGIWTSEIKDSGSTKNSFSLITKPANSKLSSIHHRMPVIIGKEIETDWLSEKTCPADLIDHLLKGSHEPDIYVDSVSNYVNSTRHSGKECIALRPRLL